MIPLRKEKGQGKVYELLVYEEVGLSLQASASIRASLVYIPQDPAVLCFDFPSYPPFCFSSFPPRFDSLKNVSCLARSLCHPLTPWIDLELDAQLHREYCTRQEQKVEIWDISFFWMVLASILSPIFEYDFIESRPIQAGELWWIIVIYAAGQS